MHTAYKIGIKIIEITFVYWITYTIVFLFIDGWHYKAISPIEEVMDIIAAILFRVGFVIYFFSVFRLVDKIMRAIEP